MISTDKYTGGDENGPRLAVGAFYFKRIAVRCPQLKYLRESGLQILQGVNGGEIPGQRGGVRAGQMRDVMQI